VEDALFRREEKRARARFLRKLATRKGVKLPRRAPLAELEQRVRPHLDRGNLNQLAFFFNQKRVSGRRR